MSIERHTTNPASGFSDAVTTVGPGRMIHVAGNVGFGPDGKVVARGRRMDKIAPALRRLANQGG